MSEAGEGGPPKVSQEQKPSFGRRLVQGLKNIGKKPISEQDQLIEQLAEEHLRRADLKSKPIQEEIEHKRALQEQRQKDVLAKLDEFDSQQKERDQQRLAKLRERVGQLKEENDAAEQEKKPQE